MLFAYNALDTEPWVGFQPDDIRIWLTKHETQEDLADAFAAVCDHETSLFHMTDEISDVWLIEAYDNWVDLRNELYQRIVSILNEDNAIHGTHYVTSGIGTYFIAKQFTERTSYRGSGGMWFFQR